MESTIVAQGIQSRVQSLRTLNWDDPALAHRATNHLLAGIASDKAFFVWSAACRTTTRTYRSVKRTTTSRSTYCSRTKRAGRDCAYT